MLEFVTMGLGEGYACWGKDGTGMLETVGRMLERRSVC